MRIITLLALLLELTFAQKIALVIGNSDYNKGYLANPVNDSKLIAKVLDDVGFDVTIKTNLKSKSEMEDVINSFATRVSSSDTVAIYYSGHGVQYNGMDYLMPTKANIAKKAQLPSVSLGVNFLLGGVSDAKLSIVMLDACRNNPYRSFIRGIPKGLGQANISVDGGMIISYATEANSVANDGDGVNSPYAMALAKYIKTSLPIETVFKKVRREVKRLTNKEQKPMTKMMFDGDFVFIEGNKPTSNPTPQPHSTLSTPQPISKPSLKWITPTNRVCLTNGGVISTYGICKASWNSAKKICKITGARLPTLDNFNQEIRDCRRGRKSNYKSCYIRKGFSDYYYWTSKSEGWLAWFIGFEEGYQFTDEKVIGNYVRCIQK